MQSKRHPTNKGKEKMKAATEKRLLPLVSYALILITGVFCIFSIVGIIHGFSRIKSFEVVGTERFVGSEMAAFAKLKRGEPLYDFDESLARENILENCAYVKKVSFKQKPFGRLCFVVKEREPVWYITISGDCYVLDKDMRVLEERTAAREEELIDEGVITFSLPHVKRAIVGELLVYGSSEEEIKSTESIIKILNSSDLSGRFTAIDIDNRYDIHLTVDNSFEVSLGSYSKLDVKIKYLARTIEGAYAEEAIGGQIDISDDATKISRKLIFDEVGINDEENQDMG